MAAVQSCMHQNCDPTTSLANLTHATCLPSDRDVAQRARSTHNVQLSSFSPSCQACARQFCNSQISTAIAARQEATRAQALARASAQTPPPPAAVPVTRVISAPAQTAVRPATSSRAGAPVARLPSRRPVRPPVRARRSTHVAANTHRTIAPPHQAATTPGATPRTTQEAPAISTATSHTPEVTQNSLIPLLEGLMGSLPSAIMGPADLPEEALRDVLQFGLLPPSPNDQNEGVSDSRDAGEASAGVDAAPVD